MTTTQEQLNRLDDLALEFAELTRGRQSFITLNAPTETQERYVFAGDDFHKHDVELSYAAAIARMELLLAKAHAGEIGKNDPKPDEATLVARKGMLQEMQYRKKLRDREAGRR